MANLEFKAGAATLDNSDPPTEDGQGLYFDADANPHIVGWGVFVPPTLRSTTSLNLKMLFVSTGSGVPGDALFKLTYYAITDSGPVLLTGTADIIVSVLNPNSIYYATIDISSWITADTTVLLIQMARDSSLPGDTLADGIYYIDGITEE